MTIREFSRDHLVFLDGGTGTLLQAAGLAPGQAPEQYGAEHPEQLVAIHRAYYEAGSHVVTANTFGVNGVRYRAEEVRRLVSGAIGAVREAARTAASPQEKFVALDIGPLGRLLAPYGDFEFEEAVEAFAVTVRAGVAAGADLIFIETMNDSYETKAAVLAAKENSTLPIWVSNAYEASGQLMTGAEPAAMVAMLEGLGVEAIGVNCSLGPAALAPVVEEYLRCASIPVLCKPNAGLPKIVDGKTVFDVSAAEYAAVMTTLIEKGVRIAGGCCGTTPEYIAALTAAVGTEQPVPLTSKHRAVVSSGSRAVSLDNGPIWIGERINPTGKKRFREALLSQDMGYILNEGLKQQNEGADILDVNVGLPEINEPEMLCRVVDELQAICTLPLQLDTADPQAMERALRRVNGKPLINSVNGKRESMEAIFPLAHRYGGVVVALTLDENGIPATAEGRLDIARRILATAAEYGITKENLIFDPLTLTVSAEPSAATVTLSAVKLIREQLGCHTVLGVSNISFGLPERDMLNGVFLTAALENGLTAAILNPHSATVGGVCRAYRVLREQDEQCRSYIAFMQAHTAAVPTVTDSLTLHEAIARGIRDAATAKTRAAVAGGAEPLALITDEVIPALNEVGKGFEEKTVFLPQLLMSAEAAAAAFEVIRAAAGNHAAGERGPFILATVQGDIHDIGKNIVKLLLENYGFAVRDLGRDVPPEAVVEAVRAEHAPLCGLSALMTTTVPAMEETVRQVHQAAPWCRVIVGGAVLTEDYAARIGADFYARDAMETVRLAERLLENKE